MATLTQSLSRQRHPASWFRQFLKEELAPYPGRTALVARMIIASTFVMILTMTFKLPFGAYGAIYAFTISRESTQATVTAAKTAIIAFALSGTYILLGAILFVGDPLLRILWIIGTLFLLFYVLSATTNYFAANRFAYLVAITIALWDRHVSAETQVEDTLWAIFGVMSASIITVAFELIFAHLKPWDDVVESIAYRLRGVESVLASYSVQGLPDEKAQKDIVRQSMLGTSRLRRILHRASYSPQYGERMGAVVALTGRLVDLAANLTYFEIHVSSGDDRKRITRLANSIAQIRNDLQKQNIPTPIFFDNEADIVHGVPLLREMQETVSQISEVFAHSPALSPIAPTQISTETSWTLFAPDAFTNPEHIRFALRGCFAASLCYLFYNAVDWPGISTAITTCLLTALTTIGASRQKQILRFGGAILGGVILGMGSQIFILPWLDSIWGFTLLYAAVIALSGWIATSSPRLSYGGAQAAVAFCLINVQEFKFQTSLAIARDRVVGIFLGLAMMWLVFDQLWTAPTAVEMKRTFISVLRSLAEFMREPRSADPKIALERSAFLRDSINKTFDKVRSLADGVLFEFGPSRQRDLALRSQIIRWHPQLRMLFVTRIALLKYRLGLTGFELPKTILAAQGEFDESLAQVLDGMANRLDGKAGRKDSTGESHIEHLENVIQTVPPEEAEPALPAKVQTFLSLSRSIENIASSLDKEI
jgi:multidrug resistance protein MdtO